MKWYKIVLDIEDEIEAEDEEEAKEKYLVKLENEPQLDYASFVADNLKAVELTEEGGVEVIK